MREFFRLVINYGLYNAVMRNEYYASKQRYLDETFKNQYAKIRKCFISMFWFNSVTSS